VKVIRNFANEIEPERKSSAAIGTADGEIDRLRIQWFRLLKRDYTVDFLGGNKYFCKVQAAGTATPQCIS